ncbi:hypothetical protein BC937DRAFT_90573 [Endogone sp. FLAS-F59071]|nr:hypothetical protein BC937DRAFT_90573 [Endogone sp. FLAS-F59071]|eukprot:RUS16984.1 hypothetical protein BC937DRAFT_90573 [Endogone sp. FLAS-F59071]
MDCPSPSSLNNGSSTTSKRVCMTMACERCRGPEFTLGFVLQAWFLTTSPSPLKLIHSAVRPPNPFARTQEHQLRSICLASIHSQCFPFLAETDMRQMQTRAQSTSNDSQTRRAYPFNDHKLSHTLDSVPMNTLPMYRSPSSPSIRGSRMSIAAGSGELETIQHDWDISLTQRGIRIDTNIALIPDLYNILLKSVNKLRIWHALPLELSAKIPGEF